MTTTNGAIFGFPNFAESTFAGNGQIAPVLGGGDWEKNRPLTRMLEDELIRAARSVDTTTASTQFDIDLGSLRDIGVFAIPKSNLSRLSQLRLQASADIAWASVVVDGVNAINATTLNITEGAATLAIGDIFTIAGDVTVYQITSVSAGSIGIKRDGITGAGLVVATSGAEVITCHTGDYTTPLLDTGFVDVWEVLYEFGTIPIEHPSFTDGKATEEDAQRFRIPYVNIPAGVVTARYVRFEIDDTSNEDGFIRLNWLTIARAIEASSGISYGAAMGRFTDTTVNASKGGSEIFTRRDVGRTFSFGLSNISVDEGLTLFDDMMSDAGINKKIFFIFDKTDKVHKHRRMMLCRLTELNPISIVSFDNVDMTHELKEVLA